VASEDRHVKSSAELPDAELMRAREERDDLRRSQQLRDETLALLVHDMKNPLAGVLSNAEYLITSKGLTPDQNDCARDILSASRRLHRLMLSLLDVNLREHGMLLPSLVTVDLTALTRQVLAENAPGFQDKALQCHLSGTHAPIRLSADRDMLARLLANLLDHAVQVSPHGSAIGVALATGQPGTVEIKVSDRGPTHSPDARAHLFETYAVPEEAQRRARKGRGLGLASCRAISEVHGGSIRLEDAPGEGNVIRVLLPVARAATG
jgi:signal transduction histidine kinase